LDYMIAPKKMDMAANVLDVQVSDHKIVVWEIEEIYPIERRPVKVINKKLAAQVSLQALHMNDSVQGFLFDIRLANNMLRNQSYLYLNSRRIERKLFTALTNSDGEMANYITTRFWKELLEENERCRFSMFSREAFSLLKRVYKYNSFEKRGGSIVTKIIEEGEIICNKEDVDRLLMEYLRTVQRDCSKPLYEDSSPTPFPLLERPTLEEMSEILKVITTNKALTDDFVSDMILDKEHFKRACEVLQDLWCGVEIDKLHFRSRLIALNKKHPEIPRKDQFRPIIVSSLLTKILEARLVKPLKKYMIERLHVSQTGCVPGMDIYVNINRMLTYVYERREKGLRTFLLHITLWIMLDCLVSWRRSIS